MPIVKYSFNGAPEGAVNVHHTENYGGEQGRTLTTWETFVGKCVEEYERNGYDDSDFFMVVEDENVPGVFHRVQYATTRAWSYPCMASRVDAMPDVVARYEQWKAAQRAAQRAEYDRVQRSVPEKGKRARVVVGRKVKVGTEADIFWVGEPVKGKWGVVEQPRVGLRLADGSRVFTVATNIRIVAPCGGLLPMARFLAAFGWGTDRDDPYATAA